MSGNMNSRTNEDSSLGVNNNSNNNAADDDEVRSTGIVYQWFCSFEDSDDDNDNDEDDLFRTVDQELGLAAAGAAFDDHHAAVAAARHHHHHNKLPLVLAWGLMLVQLATAVGSFWIGHFVLKQWQRDTCVFHDPPYSFASNGEMVLRENLNHPLKENSTISATVLFITAVWIPLVVVAVAGWFLSSSTRWASRSHRASSNHHHRSSSSYLVIPLMETVAAASGLLTSIGITEALTRILKTVVSRRRPNFYAMCQFDPSTGQCQYTAKCEAQWSFPSGHSSLSAAGMLFVTFYFAGKIIQSSRQQRQQQRQPNTTKTSWWCCCCCSPMFWCLAQAVACLTWTLYVGATRIADHWHNPSDVAAGLLLGSTIAVGVYHLYFPSLFLRQQQRHNNNKNNDENDNNKHDLAHAATPAGMPRSVAHVLRAAAQEHHHHQVSSSSRRTTMVEADDSYHAADEDDDDIDIVVDAIMETTTRTNAQPAVV